MQKLRVEQLKSRVRQGLPGRAAQMSMAFKTRKDLPMTAEDARQSAVLICLYPDVDEALHFILIERSAGGPNDPHSRQISFPGGKAEPEDIDLWATAQREAREEVGLQAADLQLIAPLTPLYIPVSNFQVSPFLAYLPYAPTFAPQAGEVETVLPTPLDWLKDESRLAEKDMEVWNGRAYLKAVPYFDFHDKVVWGATAMMLGELRQLLE